MGALKQSVAFIIAAIISAAAAAYIDAYHVLEINDGFKFRSPAAVWQFQFNIWWPIVLTMGFTFGATSQIVRLRVQNTVESPHLISACFAALGLVAMLYLTPMLLSHSVIFLIIMIGGPIVAAVIIEFRQTPTPNTNAT